MKVSQFNIVAPNQDDLVAELKIVQSEGKEDFTDEARAYLTEFYGKIDSDELKTWMTDKGLQK